MDFVGQGELQYNFRLTGDPETMVCIIGYDAPSWGGLTDSATLDIAMTVFEATLAEQLGGAYVCSSVIGRYFDSDGVVEAESTRSAVPFALGGTVLPNNCALLIHKRTGGAGRGKNGRNYLPGVPESAADAGGVLSGTYYDDMTAEVLEFFGAFTGDDLPLLTVNHGPVKVPDSDPPVYVDPPNYADVITTASLDGRIATQRRRMRP
jgi:hypothetical protein